MQTRTATQKAGGFDVTWTDEETLWALVRPAKSAIGAFMETEMLQQQYPMAEWFIAFRGERVIDEESSRFLWGTKILIPVSPSFSPYGGRGQPFTCVFVRRWFDQESS